MRALLRDLRSDRRGATLIEFAIVAPVMLLLLMGLMDLTYRIYVQSILNGAMQQAGRQASLESGPSALATIDDTVVRNVREVAQNLTWESSHKSFSDYTKIGPEPFIDLNSNGVRDPGECYSDINNNNQWDADPGKTGGGGAKDSVVYTMTIHYPRVFPMAGLMGWSTTQDVSSTTILKNQPYSTQKRGDPGDAMRLIDTLRRLRRDRRGLAMLEFGLALPIVLPIGLYGIEISNYALAQMKLSQIALTLADNASRVGAETSMNTQELREFDVDDVLQASASRGANLDIGARGRITISSLEVNSKGGQWIHWQRCLGQKSGTDYESSYGSEGDGANSTTFAGMGEPGAKVTAPAGSAVIFVEINYQYQPLFSNYLVGSTKLKSIASFIVRDNRDLSKGVTNPLPLSLSMVCALHTA